VEDEKQDKFYAKDMEAPQGMAVDCEHRAVKS
jgi:hypothetical protein